jgi:hypothetical protein
MILSLDLLCEKFARVRAALQWHVALPSPLSGEGIWAVQ